MSRHTRLFLTGFMGSGKSTIGARVADLLGYGFLDLDAKIEASTGLSIPQIFKTRGEEAFRDLETKCLLEVASSRLVIALGGGVFARAPNRATVKELGVSLWLDPDLDELVRRVGPKLHRRPLLRDKGGGALSGARIRSRLAELLADRLPFYSEADLRLSVQSGSTAAQTAAEVVRLYREHIA